MQLLCEKEEEKFSFDYLKEVIFSNFSLILSVIYILIALFAEKLRNKRTYIIQ